MNVTIDVKILAFVLVAIALIVLIIYCVKLLKRLIVTVDHTNKILKDVEDITEIAAKRSRVVDGIVDNIAESVESISDAVKGNQNIFTAVSSVIKAAAAVKNAMSKDDDPQG
ncbi:MAG TPA: hypothetical protein IAC50_07855 [Candidatus Copromorpha excrementigallinarum]|uniref:DUF948 domain-containing protein n=1 Tax=Candidatus Allocopromorpha excrementigallinarum TaxID=2840742 RepID=A0A9D1I1T9_9FIRM|nr:hypothetical protein [Candidatus Copromorpha excrementigallinarum]